MAEALSMDNPVFTSYIFYAMVVLLKMLFMPFLTGYARGKKQVYMFPEDVQYFGKGKKEDAKPVLDDPDVERTRKNHHHDLENIPAFVMVGFFYVLCGPSPWLALWHFRIYAVSKILHTVCYQLALQPWRAVTHIVGYVLLLSMSFQALFNVCCR